MQFPHINKHLLVSEGPQFQGNLLCKYMHFSLSKHSNGKTEKVREKHIGNLIH